MRPCAARCFSLFILLAIPGPCGFASPADFKLLPLVPPHAQIVSGFLNVHSVSGSGRLLLTTHNNRLDLDDWVSLSGVDTERICTEVIEVAATTMGGVLNEHLLLVAGRFDRDRIYRAAQENGAQPTRYLGQTALVVKPFAREQGDMLDTRWLVILNNQAVLFGTAETVQQALRRYDNHSAPDQALLERLAALRADVTSWNVMASASAIRPDIFFGRLHGPWSHLLQDTDVLMISAHFGSTIRLDLLAHVQAEKQSAYFAEKVGVFREAFARQPPDHAAGSPEEAQPRLQDLRVDRDQVRCSLVLSRHEFEAWKDRELSLNRATFHSAPATRGN